MRKYTIPIVILIGLFGCSERRSSLDMSQPTSLGIALKFDYKSKTDPNYYQAVFDAATDKTAVRNQIIFEVMGKIDDDFEKFSRDLRSDRAYKDTIVKMLSISITGVASFAQETTANVLAASDTALKGASEAVDTNAFRNYAPELLINQMRASRAAIAEQIYSSMTKSDLGYTLQESFCDLARYYNEGSVTSALAALAASTALKATTSIKSADEKKAQINNQ